MTFGSLFAGIGGIDLGLERAGLICRWQVEIDPFCNRVLEKHWPGVKRYGDITKLTGNELEPVDLICGGFPCQDLSQAGKRTPYLAWAVDHVAIKPDLVDAITHELLDRNMREMAQLFEDCPTAIDRMRDVLQDLFRALERYGFESHSLSQLKNMMETQ